MSYLRMIKGWSSGMALYEVKTILGLKVMTKKKKQQRARKTYKVFSYRGFSMEELVKMTNEQFLKICTARSKRKVKHGIKLPTKFLKKLRKAKKACKYGDKPKMVKTHKRNMIVLPEMVGSIVGVHNGQDFITLEVKNDMLGHKLGEFALTFKPVKHGKPGIGGTKSSKFVPLK